MPASKCQTTSPHLPTPPPPPPPSRLLDELVPWEGDALPEMHNLAFTLSTVQYGWGQSTMVQGSDAKGEAGIWTGGPFVRNGLDG